jgi:hypothetical protein
VKPRWQRAKIVASTPGFKVNPRWMGALLWTEIASMKEVPIFDVYGNGPKHCRNIDTNIMAEFLGELRRTSVPLDCIELLSGPEDFAEDIELISLEHYLSAIGETGGGKGPST